MPCLRASTDTQTTRTPHTADTFLLSSTCRCRVTLSPASMLYLCILRYAVAPIYRAVPCAGAEWHTGASMRFTLMFPLSF